MVSKVVVTTLPFGVRPVAQGVPTVVWTRTAPESREVTPTTTGAVFRRGPPPVVTGEVHGGLLFLLLWSRAGGVLAGLRRLTLVRTKRHV